MKFDHEDEAFVSSSTELLSQFKRIDIRDHVCCHLYIDNGSLIDYIEFRSYLESKLSTIVKSIDYIWQTKEMSFIVIAKTNKNGSDFCIQGLTYYGDNVEDEWFTVYFLFAVSCEVPHVSIHVTDADGQFLLIEAAEVIPQWLGPHNSVNRTWIRSGKLHIISHEDGGRLRAGGVRRKFALERLRQAKSSLETLADESVQKAISNRISAYPGLALANMHTCICTLPRDVALVLLSDPQLVAEAVETFCECERSEKGSMASMRHFGVSNLVTVPIRMSKVLYAQLSFQSFHPPSRFHAALKESSMATASESPSVAKAVAKALEIGCRVACALELAYQRSLSQSKLAPNNGYLLVPSEAKVQRQLTQLEALGVLMKDETEKVRIQGALKSGYIVLSRSDGSESNDESGVPRDRPADWCDLDDPQKLYPAPMHPIPGLLPFHTRVDAITKVVTSAPKELVPPSHSTSPNAHTLLAKQCLHDYVASCRDGRAGNDDSWLYLSPEELDKEMAARAEAFNTSSSKSAEEVPMPIPMPIPMAKEVARKKSAVHDGRDEAVAQSLVDGMRRFMVGKSGIDGVEDISVTRPQGSNTRDPPTDIGKGNQMRTYVPSKGLDLDLNKLSEILKMTSLDSESATCRPSRPSARPSVATVLDLDSDDEEHVDAGDLVQGLVMNEQVNVGDYSSGNSEDNKPTEKSVSATSYLGSDMGSGTDTRKADGASGQPSSPSFAHSLTGTASHSVSLGGLAKSGMIRELTAADSDDEEEEGEGGTASGSAEGDDSCYDSDDEDEEEEELWSGWLGSGRGRTAGDDSDEDEKFLETYMSAMDRQLSSMSTVLHQSFERFSSEPKLHKQRTQNGTASGHPVSDEESDSDEDGHEEGEGEIGADDDVDVEGNFLKYLLESHASQMGVAGPAGNLLSQLGLQMPAPPL